MSSLPLSDSATVFRSQGKGKSYFSISKIEFQLSKINLARATFWYDTEQDINAYHQRWQLFMIRCRCYNSTCYVLLSEILRPDNLINSYKSVHILRSRSPGRMQRKASGRHSIVSGTSRPVLACWSTRSTPKDWLVVYFPGMYRFSGLRPALNPAY